MSKPIIIQTGPYLDWDQAPIDTSFQSGRLFEAADPAAFLAEHGPSARTIETRQAMGQLLRDNLTAHFAGDPLLTPVL